MRASVFLILLAARIPLHARADCLADQDAARAALSRDGNVASAHALHAAERACLEQAHAKLAEAHEFLAKGDRANGKASLLEAFRLASQVKSDEDALAMELMVQTTSAIAVPLPRKSKRMPEMDPPRDAGDVHGAPHGRATHSVPRNSPEHPGVAERIGEEPADGQDSIQARVNLRAALHHAESEKDTEAVDRIKPRLDEVEAECLKNAARQIQEAKVYLDAENYEEAIRAVTLALRYADAPGTPEHQSAFELRKRILRNTETPR